VSDILLSTTEKEANGEIVTTGVWRGRYLLRKTSKHISSIIEGVNSGVTEEKGPKEKKWKSKTKNKRREIRQKKKVFKLGFRILPGE